MDEHFFTHWIINALMMMMMRMKVMMITLMMMMIRIITTVMIIMMTILAQPFYVYQRCVSFYMSAINFVFPSMFFLLNPY